jgi:hypothetical protein
MRRMRGAVAGACCATLMAAWGAPAGASAIDPFGAGAIEHSELLALDPAVRSGAVTSLPEPGAASVFPLASSTLRTSPFPEPTQLAPVSPLVSSGTDFGLDGFRFADDALVVTEPRELPRFVCGLVGLWGLALLGRGPGLTGPPRRRARGRAATRP